MDYQEVLTNDFNLPPNKMRTERELPAVHTTIMRCVHRSEPELNKRIKPFLCMTNNSWRCDETFIKINGKWKYLYCAVDS